MGKAWLDPTPGNSCPTCKHFDGRVFADGEELPLPAHPGCECLYITTDEAGTVIDWDSEPGFARETYVNYAAWLLREGRTLPKPLEPLRADAERRNKQRKDRNSMTKKTTQLRINNYYSLGRVDREAHVIYDVSAMTAGEALGHRLILDDVTLQQLSDQINAKQSGVKARFTHPGLSQSGLSKFLGRYKNARVVADRVIGDLHLSAVAAKSPDGDLRGYVEERALEDPESFGMSAVIKVDRIWILKDGTHVVADRYGKRPESATTKYPIARVVSTHAVDAVDEPAANPNGMFSVGFNQTTNILAHEAFVQLDSFILQSGYSLESALSIIERYAAGGDLPKPFSLFAESAHDDYSFDDERAREFAGQYCLHREHFSIVPDNLLVADRPDDMGGKNTMTKMLAEPVEETAVTTQLSTQNEWVEALAQSSIAVLLDNSGLPSATIKRLKAGEYDDPTAVNAAIALARKELDELAADETVNIGGRHPRQAITSGDMVTSLDDAKNTVNWVFGVEGAKMPAYNMRRFDQLYVALTGDVNFTGLFQQEYLMFAAATTTTLPQMALDAMNKIVRAQFSRLRYYRWYELIATVEPNDGSLHDPKWIVYGGTGDLPAVAEGAVYTEGNIGDSKETDPFVKRGRYVGITRRMIKNSDIMKIRAVPVALATDSVRTRSAQFASIFTSNSGVGPTLSDGDALFHANHSNVATTALGTDTTAWEAASEECFAQAEVGSSKAIATFAKYLLAPSELYFQGLKNFGYGDGNPTTYNPFAVKDRSPEDPRPVVLAVPDFTDSNDWAYVADPNIWPTVVCSYSQNPGGGSHPEPELFSVTSELSGLMFTNDVLPIKVRDEYAIGVNGSAGIGKRNVA